ncbi:MAG: J domain-containing protein [Magnetococcales bacterium]|nr:J domain-containing protein [Magnetococcales bacterium]
MKNPFHLLNLTPEADDKTIEAAYKRLKTIHSKAASPKREKEIEWAYQTIKNPRDRISFKLFQTPTADLPTLLGPSLSNLTPANPTRAATLDVLSNSLKSYQLAMPDEGG